jgi:ribonuclease D
VDSYVRSDAELAAVVAELRAGTLVAVDTEAASFHKYVDRVYLVQLSSRTRTAIVDPLAVGNLSPIGALLVDPAVEKVFHDADYDLRILDRDYGFRAVRLFDTRIAAQLLGEPAIGLGSLLEKHLGIKLSKTHQKADWSQRPLPPAMLAYAADDTRHLPRLRDLLHEQLVSRGRIAWVQEECKRLEELRWTRGGGGGAGGAGGGGGASDSDEEAYLRVKGAKALRPRDLAAFRELYAWREAVAQREDKAPFRIIGNDPLLAVSRALPETAVALAKVVGLPPSLARRHGPALLEAVHRARALPEAELPRLVRPPRGPKDPKVDERVEKLKAARNRVAGELGLDPGVLCGRTTLEAVARAAPKDRAGLAAVGELRRWQFDVLGDALLAALA